MFWIILIIVVLICIVVDEKDRKEDIESGEFMRRFKVWQQHIIVNQIKAEEELAEYKAKHPERFSTK